MTRWSPVVFLLSFFFFSCNSSDNDPDVSDVKIELKTERFERELFALDSSNFTAGLDQLQAKYPEFGENYIYSILGADPLWNRDTVSMYVRKFTQFYQNVYDSSELVFKDFVPYEKEIKHGLQYLKHYFPNYAVPKKIVTYIGPLDGIGVAAGDDIICVGLHLHLGANFSLYRSALVREIYPEYLSTRFGPDYISVDCFKLLLNNLYPEKMDDRALVLQMVEKGKRLYLLSKILPDKEEYKLIGYAVEQLKAAYQNEDKIWNLFVQNNFLRTTDYNIIKNFIGEGPKTQELGEGSPGNIGSFTGWQIVKKYMQKNSKITLAELMSTDAEVIFQAAKYKP